MHSIVCTLHLQLFTNTATISLCLLKNIITTTVTIFEKVPKYDYKALGIIAFNILEKGQSLVKALFIYSFIFYL